MFTYSSTGFSMWDSWQFFLLLCQALGLFTIALIILIFLLAIVDRGISNR